MSVKQLLESMDSRELGEWIAYHTYVETIGDTRQDLRAGIIASTIANVNRGKNRPAFKPNEFMPYYTKPKQTETQMLEALKSAFSQGGK